jgi:hypothetical protein
VVGRWRWWYSWQHCQWWWFGWVFSFSVWWSCLSWAWTF